MYMLYENKYIYNLQGGLGKQKNFKKIKQNGGFSFILFLFFAFLAGLPRSPKL